MTAAIPSHHFGMAKVSVFSDFANFFRVFIIFFSPTALRRSSCRHSAAGLAPPAGGKMPGLIRRVPTVCGNGRTKKRRCGDLTSLHPALTR